MDINELRKYKKQIIQITKKNKALNIRVFGSVSTGDAQADSDVDFLIDIGDGQNLLDFIRLQQELADLLLCDVDLAPSSTLREEIKSNILETAIPIEEL
ncbi:MAG: nucleotidyltransferase domain-containing protein [Cyanobacteria bacterium J06621_8]